MTAEHNADGIVLEAKGRLLTTAHKSPSEGDVLYHLTYKIGANGVELTASASGVAPAPLQFIVPVIARADESFSQSDARTVRIAKSKGRITVETDAAEGFEEVPQARTFNLVPGFEAIPLSVVLRAGKEVRVKIAAE